MVAISARTKDFEPMDDFYSDGSVYIPYEGLRTSGLVHCLIVGSKNISNPQRSQRCLQLLELINLGVEISVSPSLTGVNVI